VYLTDGDVHRAHGLAVLTLRGRRISAVTRFVDTAVMSRFGLPRMLYQNDLLSPDQ
jgi:ketosteroid isomerase-like protein